MTLAPGHRGAGAALCLADLEAGNAMDILVLAIGGGFFAVMFGYVRICERL